LERVETARQSLRLAGRSDAEIDSLLAQAGLAQLPDSRTPAQKAYDKVSGLDRQPTASDYNIDWTSAQRNQSPTDLAEAHAIIGGALAATGLPPGLGSSLYEHARTEAQAYAKLDKNGQANWLARQELELVRQVGQEAAAKMTADAKAFIDRAGGRATTAAAKEGIELLKNSPGLRSAWAIRTLANYGSHFGRIEALRPR
jgi:hypothetical protein